MPEEDVGRTGREVAEMLATDAAYREKLVALAREKFHLDRETALDLLQETAVILLSSDQPIRNPDGFAYHLFHTRCCHLVERLARRRRLSVGAPGLPAAVPASSPAGEDLGLALRQAMDRISPKCRALLRSHYWEGRTIAETAAFLSAGKGTVSTLVSRCLGRLRRILECERR